MEQDTSNIVSPKIPRRGPSGYKVAALILVIAAVLIVAGAVFVPRLIKSDKSIKTTVTITATISATLSATATKSPSASAVSTKSAATDTSAGAQNSSATATAGANTSAVSGTASCTTSDFNLDESRCSSQTPERVCGVIRYVYDNGEEATRSNTFTNVCEYCAQFDANGFLELRGTKMYSKGYSMGQCQ